jgi:hypothetical protein
MASKCLPKNQAKVHERLQLVQLFLTSSHNGAKHKSSHFFLDILEEKR